MNYNNNRGCASFTFSTIIFMLLAFLLFKPLVILILAIYITYLIMSWYGRIKKQNEDEEYYYEEEYVSPDGYTTRTETNMRRPELTPFSEDEFDHSDAVDVDVDVEVEPDEDQE